MLRSVRLIIVVCLTVMADASLEGRLWSQETRKAVESSDRLAAAVKSAASSNWENCSGFLGDVTELYLNGGETISRDGNLRKVYRNVDLHGMQANAQIDHMTSKWKKVDMAEAVKLADQGRLVVAAIKASPNGHVAVVMPGGLDKETKWPRVAGGAMNPIARSETGQSMSKVWKSKFLKPSLQIGFYTPWFTAYPVAVDTEPKATESIPKTGTQSIVMDDNAPKGGIAKPDALVGTQWTGKWIDEMTGPNGEKWKPVNWERRLVFKAAGEGDIYTRMIGRDSSYVGIEPRNLRWEQRGDRVVLHPGPGEIVLNLKGDRMEGIHTTSSQGYTTIGTIELRRD